jgi:uncharacterized protein YutE (UPF0331/DUF86 family)
MGASAVDRVLATWHRRCECLRSTLSTCGERRCGYADGYWRRAGCCTAQTSPAGSPSRSALGAVELLAGYLFELRRLRDLPIVEYLHHEVYAGRYLVQVAAQTCIDLANHLITSEGWRSPRDFGDSFTILGEHSVIDDALAGRLRGLAGLRNRLMHVYDEIDDTRVHKSLVAGLPDLDTFATALAKLVSRASVAHRSSYARSGDDEAVPVTTAPCTGHRHVVLGEALRGIGQLSEARKSWLEALSIFDDLGAPEAAQVRVCLETLNAHNADQRQ